VAILHRLQHPYVIDFIGVVLQPLCFILEWAPGGSLHSILQKYRKLDARVSPKALKKTAYQVRLTEVGPIEPHYFDGSRVYFFCELWRILVDFGGW